MRQVTVRGCAALCAGAAALFIPVAGAYADQVVPDDQIVQGSLCVGLDCVDNEIFGFNTIVVKENNTRIYFDDTSTSAGFAANDWALVANDSVSGGASYFGIQDATSGRMVFRVDAGAPQDALHVSSLGNLGLGTSTPALGLHIARSDTPAIRLEQTNAGGFTAQTWDIGANEANFFVRDLTGGSRLPFRIRPGAPTSSLDIAASGDVGIGTASPGSELHVYGASSADTSVTIGTSSAASSDGLNVGYLGATYGTGTSMINAHSTSGNGGRLLLATDGVTRLTLDGAGNVGIGTDAPVAGLDVVGSIRFASLQGCSSGIGTNASGDLACISGGGSGTPPSSGGGSGTPPSSGGGSGTPLYYVTTASGTQPTASGSNSTAAGSGSTASGSNAYASGTNNQSQGDDSTVVGSNNIVTGNRSGAFGTGNTVNGDGTYAIGDPNLVNGNRTFVYGDDNTVNAANTVGFGDDVKVFGSNNVLAGTASASGSLLIGTGSSVNAANAVALGNATRVTGASGVAIGQGASAGGAGAVAVGAGASAGYAGSSAYGAGAVASRENQQVFGTAGNTYTAPGITSAASTAAQAGAVSIVTTDPGGNLASASPWDFGFASASDLDRLSSRIDNVGKHANSGVAMAMALAGAPTVLPDENFVTTINWGAFEGANAFALSAGARINSRLQVNGGVAYDPDQHLTGGRVGVRMSW
ncbi:YadA-like family protein [Aurantimonas sp. HBX-1]|uniref:YadA-like family protein n=1 Tax=Aurantimonas sp. HBX-1 TaxID=2906072 RepID=UPI001F21B063|nr:YadA-like family protein [Aurantimonas sp. HBX-1]UIJ73908.1 YadA-like family protein [Aurantimonas sp. HBX-1]